MAIALAGLAGAALCLRLIGIDFGRPYIYHADEWIVAQPAIGMVQRGDWDPQLFWYPSALMYAERFLVGIVHLVTGAPLETEIAYGFDQLAYRGYYETVPEQFPFYLAGRILVAVLGTVTVILAYFAGRLLAGPVAGIAASLVMAVTPLAVRHGHFLTTDVPSAMFVTATLALALMGRDRMRPLILAGLCAGFAASTKYNAGAVLLVPVVIALLAPGSMAVRLRTSAAIVLASIVGFVVLTPLAVLDPAAIIDALRFQVSAYGAIPGAGPAANLWHYLVFLASPLGIGIVLAMASAAGAIIAVRRRGRGDLAIVLYTVVYLVILSIPAARFERNLLPLLPALAVLTGLAVRALIDRASTRPIPLAVAAIIVIVMGGAQVATGLVTSERSLAGPDTRTLALDWVEDNVPAGSRVVRELYTPQLSPGRYEVGVVGRLTEKPLEWYRAQGVDYLIASSYRFGQGGADSEAYDEFFRQPIAFEAAADLQPRIVVFRLQP